MKNIQLLDGSIHDRDVLINKMIDDSFYYGYMAQAALSSSSCKLLLESPKTYRNIIKYGSEQSSPALTTGRLIHLGILEPHKLDDQFEIVDVATKTTKLWKDRVAHHAGTGTGKTCVTRKEYNDATKSIDAFLRNDKAVQYLNGSEFEIPMVDAVLGYPFRAKADIINREKGFIADIKTTSDLRAFPYSAKKYSYDLQAALYCYMYDIHWSNFHFLVVDKASGDIGIYHCSQDFHDRGAAKLAHAIETFEIYFDKKTQDIDSYTIEETL